MLSYSLNYEHILFIGTPYLYTTQRKFFYFTVQLLFFTIWSFIFTENQNLSYIYPKKFYEEKEIKNYDCSSLIFRKRKTRKVHYRAQIRFVMLFSSSEIDLPSLEMWQIVCWYWRFLELKKAVLLLTLLEPKKLLLPSF